MRVIAIRIGLLCGLMVGLQLFSFGQTPFTRTPPSKYKELGLVDFTGTIKKYDVDFAGIGPKVYLLPPPPPREELLRRQYIARLEPDLKIPKMLSKRDVLSNLKRLDGGNVVDVARLVGTTQSTEGWLLMEIDFAEQCGQRERAAQMRQLLAYEYVRVGDLDQAITLYEQAAETKNDGDPQYRKSIQTIDFNLGLLHLFKENLSQAYALFARVLDQAKSDQNKELQGLLMCKLAYVKAKQGRYHEAEQDIIVRVVPHFRQLKSSAGYKGLVEAYMTLSDIYRLQNRHPEAQWFLLQAREVVNTHHLRQYMPDIVFALAEVKKVSGNTEVALDEYRMVEKMLDGRSDSLLMHLAILDAISAIYHRHGEHEEALHALDQFDRLKTQLISSDFLF